jgi:hypothetical protein
MVDEYHELSYILLDTMCNCTYDDILKYVSDCIDVFFVFGRPMSPFLELNTEYPHFDLNIILVLTDSCIAVAYVTQYS